MGCTQSSSREPPAATRENTSQRESPSPSRAGSRIAALSRPSNGQSAVSAPTPRSRARLRTPRPWSNNTTNPTQTYWTPSSIAREREIFFETRVSGQPEVWAALALAVEMVRDASNIQAQNRIGSSLEERPDLRNAARELTSAQSVLDAAGISVPRGRLEDGAWDERGAFYAIPQWVLTDPADLRADGDMDSIDVADEEADEVEKEGLDDSKQATPGAMVQIRARLSDRGTDVLVSVREDQSISNLIKAIRNGAEIPSTTQIRIAYLGKILKENQSLRSQGWQNGHIVNALIF